MVSGWLPPISAFLQTHRYFVVGVIRQACPESVGAWCVAAFTIKTSWGAVSFFIFSSALRNRRAGSVWSCAVVLHFEAVQELSGPRASKLIRVPERMRSFCNYFGHVDRSFPVGRRDSYLWQYLELPSERLEGCKNISGACLRYEPQACYTPRTSRSARLSRKYPERSFFLCAFVG